MADSRKPPTKPSGPGLLFDRAAAEGAERLKDEMALLKGQAQGTAFELVRNLLPSLSGLVSGIRELLAENPRLRTFDRDAHRPGRRDRPRRHRDSRC